MDLEELFIKHSRYTTIDDPWMGKDDFIKAITELRIEEEKDRKRKIDLFDEFRVIRDEHGVGFIVIEFLDDDGRPYARKGMTRDYMAIELARALIEIVEIKLREKYE